MMELKIMEMVDNLKLLEEICRKDFTDPEIPKLINKLLDFTNELLSEDIPNTMRTLLEFNLNSYSNIITEYYQQEDILCQ